MYIRICVDVCLVLRRRVFIFCVFPEGVPERVEREHVMDCVEEKVKTADGAAVREPVLGEVKDKSMQKILDECPREDS